MFYVDCKSNLRYLCNVFSSFASVQNSLYYQNAFDFRLILASTKGRFYRCTNANVDTFDVRWFEIFESIALARFEMPHSIVAKIYALYSDNSATIRSTPASSGGISRVSD